MNKKLELEMIFRKVGIDVDSIKKEELKQFEMNKLIDNLIFLQAFSITELESEDLVTAILDFNNPSKSSYLKKIGVYHFYAQTPFEELVIRDLCASFSKIWKEKKLF
jgi:hypothetical protein